MKRLAQIIIIIVMVLSTVFSAGYSYVMLTKNQTEDVSVVAMMIKQLPTKLEYWDGEFFDPTGLVLVVQYSNGTIDENVTEGFDWDLKDPLTADNDEVKISMGNKVKYLEISVNVRTPASLTVIQKPNRLVYAAGEKFSPEGMTLLATYDDGSQRTLTEGFMYPSTKLQEGAESVTIRYNGKSIELPIKVLKPAKSVEVICGPVTTSYMAGQFFDPTGMVIMATFEDDTTMDITGLINLSTKRLDVDDTKISFNVLGTSFEQEVTVTPNPHVKANVFAEVPETCTEDGTKAYVTCSHCNKFFTDEYMAYEISDLTIAKHHILAASEENPANGVQIKKCIRCDSDYSESPEIYYNFTKNDIINKNDTKLTDTSSSSSKNIMNANQFAYKNQYMLNFKQEGDGVQYTFVADKAGKVTIVLKMSSAFFKTIYRSEGEKWSTGDMQLNKVADIRFNGELIRFADHVMLYGSDSLKGSVPGTTEGNQTYANTVNWQYITFEADVAEGENTITVQTKACTLYPDINNIASGYSSFALDTVAIYGDILNDEGGEGGEGDGEEKIDISDTVKEFVHEFTSADQSAINFNNPPEGRFDLTYHTLAGSPSKNIKKALELASNGDYLTHFYGGAAVTKQFNSTVAGKATVTIKMASGYITRMENFSTYETGDMIVNKIMKITVNGVDVVLGDDVVLKGDKTRKDYSCMGMWTTITFEIDVKIGKNSIVLTSLFPGDENGNPLYFDPGINGTQSSFQLDNMMVSMGKHEHSFGAWTKVDDTNHARSCACGEKETKAHSFDEGVETKAPTHLEAGVKTFTCADCGHTKTEALPKIETHSFGDWTMVDDTNHQRSCACGEKETVNHGWDEGVITQAPTEEIEGIKLYTCSDCGHTKSVSVGTLSHTHKFATEWSHDGEYHWYATTCGHDDVEGVVTKIAHDWGSGVETKAPTHLEAGVKTYTCSECSATKTEALPKIEAHSFGEWTKVDDTNHSRSCECGEKETETHSFGEGVITKEPTADAEGERTYTCSVCQATRTEAIERLESGDLTSNNLTFTHNFTNADQTAQNTNPPENRKNLTYHNILTATSANIKKALALAEGGDYLTHFYGGAAVKATFTSTVAGKATVTFKIASGYLTYVSSNYANYKSGDMIVNKIIKFTVNGVDIVLSDDVVLKGVTTTGSYAIMGQWTDVTFEIDVKAGENTIVLTSIFPDDGTGKSLYKDGGDTGTQSSFQLDTMTVSMQTLEYDISEENNSLTHNFTKADQTAQNNSNPPSNRKDINYVSSATASSTAKLATDLATEKDYVSHFYGGAAVTKTFTSAVSGKAIVTFKIASGFLTKAASGVYQTGDMVVNKVMKITVNGTDIVFGDDLVLKGDSSTNNYKCMANWTYISFEIDLKKGMNTIVLTSLFPGYKADGVTPLYKDPGTNGTQSSFHLDTVTITLKPKADISESNNSFTHNFTPVDQTAQNDHNPPAGRYDLYYATTATASTTMQKATKLAENEDYLTRFYGGAAVTKTFTSSVAGKATVTFKIASGYLTKGILETGDMIVNKVMKFTVNGLDVVLGDDVVLKGDKTKQSYACMGVWTEISFEMDVKIGENTIVLTSLFPDDGTGSVLYFDAAAAGATPTQSTFQLDTVTIEMVAN